MATSGALNGDLSEDRLSDSRLTLERLSKVPKRDAHLFLSDYLRGQRTYRKDYATDGLAEVASWNDTKSSLESGSGAKRGALSRDLPLDAFALGTPILKPRVPQAKPVNNSGRAAEKLGSKDHDEAQKKATAVTPAAKDSTNQGKRKRTTAVSTKEKSKPTKERIIEEKENSGDEHAERLKERRQRKRAKKAILEPPPPSESDKENGVSSSKNKRGKKDKVDTNLALMHGFSATNVGKNRITLEPLLRNLGVFKKGKASCTSKVVAREKKRAQDVCFSETRFLKNANAYTKRRTKRKAAPSVSSSSSTDDDPSRSTKCDSKHNRRLPTKKVDKVDDSSEKGSNVSQPTSDHTAEARIRRYDPADSIVWDIERESYVEESETNGRQGTIVLNFPTSRPPANDNLALSLGSSPLPSVYPNENPDAGRGSEVSLRPSQSASRVAEGNVRSKEERSTQPQYFTSKYFGVLDRPRSPKDAGMLHVDLSPQRPPSDPDHQDTPELLDHAPNYNTAPLEGCSEPSVITWCPPLDDGMDIEDYMSPYDVRSSREVGVRLHGDVEHTSGYSWCLESGHENLDSIVSDCGDFDSWQPMDDCEVNQHNGLGVFDSNSFIEYDHHLIGPTDEEHHWILGEDDLLVPPEGGCVGYDESSHMGVDDFSGMYTCYSESGCPSRTSDCGSLLDSGVLETDLMGDHFSQDDDNESDLARFAQGRTLLFGLNPSSVASTHRISSIEAEVAGNLRQNHWLPHRL